MVDTRAKTALSDCPRCTELAALHDATLAQDDGAATLAALLTAMVHTSDVHGAELSGRPRCATCRQFLVLLRGDPHGRVLDLCGWHRDAALHFADHTLAARQPVLRDAELARA